MGISKDEPLFEESLITHSTEIENNRPFLYKSNEELDTSLESDCSLEIFENLRKHYSYKEEKKFSLIKKITDEKNSKSFLITGN